MGLAVPGIAQQPGPVGPAYYSRLEKDPAPKATAQLPPSLAAALPSPVEYRFAPLAEAERESAVAGTRVPVVGVHRALQRSTAEQGDWQTLPDGRRIWRLALRSPGAAGYRLHFTDFSVGNGKVWLHDGRHDRPQVVGPYTGGGVFGNGDFWSDVVYAESVVVEYETGNPDSGSPETPFRIVEISHLWSTIPAASGLGRAGNDSVDLAARCHVDLSCHPEWLESAKGVAGIQFERDGRSLVCSGSLLNTRNRSFTPYFLTAAHCISNDATARTVLAVWFYQTSTCNGTPPRPADLPRSLGARYLAGRTMQEGDPTLLLLNSVPSGALFLGWDPDDPPVGRAVVGIHHPAGDYKRISFGARESDDTMGLPPQNFLKVRWQNGLTEGGSSGSPLFSAPNVVSGMLSHGPRPQAGQTTCDVEPIDFYGRFSLAYPLLREFLEDRAPVGQPPPNPTPPPAGIPTLLTSRVPARFSFDAVSNPTLILPGWGVEVPQGATRLEVRVATTTPGVDVDLFVRFDSQPAISGGNIVADYRSTGDTGNETIVITTASSPPLRAGKYFIALVLFSTGVAASGTVTATVDTSGPPPTSTSTLLGSGTPVEFALPAISHPTLFTGDAGYRVVVPEGATRLEVRIVTSTANVDVDVFIRFGAEVTLSEGNAVADYSSTGPTGNELITITSSSTPPLRPGAYYISLAVLTTGTPARGSIVATVGTATATPRPANVPVSLTSGVAVNFSLPAVNNPSLFFGGLAYRIVVPEGATRLEVRIVTSPATVDTDLFVRFGGEPNVAEGRIVADFASIGNTGLETIVVSSGSSPPLLPGTYYIAISMFTTGVAASGTVTATVDRTPSPAPSGARVLNPGGTANFSLPAVSGPTVFTGDAAYRITVPQGATRLEVRVITSTAGADVDLYVRIGVEPAVENGRVVADYRSVGQTGNESIVITASSSQPLQAGAYFIALALFSTGTAASGTISASLDASTGGGLPALASIVNAASFVTGAVAPGEVVSIFGSAIGPAQGVGGRLNLAGRVDTWIADTVVTFDGVPAPLYFVGATQINAQVPYTVDGRTTTQVRVIRQGRVSNALAVPVAASAPGLFTSGADNRAFVVNEDGSLNSTVNPAAPGAIVVLFATGEGQTSPPGVEGVLAEVPLPRPALEVSLQIGGRAAEVLFAGSAPGFAGLLQVNARVPQGVTASDQAPVILTVGNARSQPGTVMSVR